MKLSILTFTAALALASAAFAVPTPGDTNTPSMGLNGFFFKPYLGADYQYTSVSYQDIGTTGYSYGDIFANSFNGGNVHIGARVHKNLGLEVGYFDNASESKSSILGTTATSSVKLDGWTFDALGYLPLGESQRFELIGTAGVAITSAKAKGSITISGTTYSGFASKTETEGRFGAGAQYWLTDHLNVRGLVRYQSADLGGVADSAIVSTLGLNWQF